ncbi:MAG: heavy-metal-associated domain-containing protein [Taibaiella sp.]|nr:heavy-metal-associated domain-containing protein [Taibaiella sp.]
MKYIGSLLLSVFLFFGAQAAEKKATLTVKTSIACDHCLQCSSCGQNINDKIRDTEKGIRKVKVDPKANTITVTYAPDKTNPEQIKKAIAAAGFDADEVKATADAYEKLDGCCKAK